MNIVTHNGKFHPDEVFAVATLLLLYPDAKVARSRDMNLIKDADIAVDVGGEYDPPRGRFDHHQLGGAGTRENAVPYSSFGLVWKHFGEKVSGDSDVARDIELRLVNAMDADDGGISMYGESTPVPYGIENLIYVLDPVWTEESEIIDEQFFKAVEIAKTLLAREIVHTKGRLMAKNFVEEAYKASSDRRIIVLDKPYPSSDVLTSYPEPLFVIKPAPDNSSWSIKGVPNYPGSFESRKLFPERWAAKRDEELVKETGVEGAIFCHKDRWIARASSKEGAIALATLALRD